MARKAGVAAHPGRCRGHTRRGIRLHLLTGVVATLLLSTLTLRALAQEQLVEGQTIRIISVPLNVRGSPGTSGEIIGQVAEQRTATVIDGSPYWADGYWWWRVDLGSGLRGWVAEGDASERFLEAISAPDATAAQKEAAAETMPREEPPVTVEAAAAEPVTETTPQGDKEAAPGPLPRAVGPEVRAMPVLPHELEVEREVIDEEYGGLRIALAWFAPTTGRGGPAFSWEFTRADSLGNRQAAAGGHYWCDGRLLTGGPPFYALLQGKQLEEFDALLELAGGSLANGRLRLWDFELSCTADGGLQLQSRNLNRTLAVLGSPAAVMANGSPTGEEHALRVVSQTSVASGEVHWLEITNFDLPETVTGADGPQLYPLAFDDAGQLESPEQLMRFAAVLHSCDWLGASRAASRTALPTQECQRHYDGNEVGSVLNLDAERGSIKWLVSPLR